jgi:branched-chain amino acid transport system substrate-binding protein
LKIRVHAVPALAGVLFYAALSLFPVSSARAAEDFDINVILSLTGPGAFLGKGEQQALQFAEKAVNDSGGIQGRPIAFVFHDDQTNPQVAVQLATDIIAAKPAVILGSSLVATCRAMMPLMADGPVMYCFSPGIHPDAGSNVFTASVSTVDLADAAIRYFHMKGWKKFGLIFSTDASGQDAEKNIDALLQKPENKDIQVTAREHFNTTDLSVSAQIENIKASKPQALIVWSTGAPVATVFRAIQQTGLDVPVATTDGNMTYAQMTQYKSFLPRQLYIPAAQWVVRDPTLLSPAVAAKSRVFYKAFEDNGVQPDIASELAWEPGMIVIEALKKLGTGANAAQLRAALEQTKGYAGVNGIYDFTAVPQRGLDVSDTVVTRWAPAKNLWEIVSKPTGIPLN